jgi:NADH-quinone oxidoreductase subunit F
MTDALPLTGRARPDRTPHTLEEWRRSAATRPCERGLTKERPRRPRHGRHAASERARRCRLPGGAEVALHARARQAPGDGPSYLIVNGDEMEPGAFKDRILLEALPHQLIEGAILTAFATHATEIIVLIRDSLPPDAIRVAAPSRRPRRRALGTTSSAPASI